MSKKCSEKKLWAMSINECCEDYVLCKDIIKELKAQIEEVDLEMREIAGKDTLTLDDVDKYKRLISILLEAKRELEEIQRYKSSLSHKIASEMPDIKDNFKVDTGEFLIELGTSKDEAELVIKDIKKKEVR